MSGAADRPYAAYDDFAWFYHRYWSEPIPLRLLTVVERLLLAALPPAARVLDLCCGTGRIARELVARGYAVTGVDGSEAMLRIAREQAPQASFVHADARRFMPGGPFDGALSLFDSLNHVTSLDELEAVFRCVHAALRPAAPFLFDLNDDASFRTHWTGESYTVVEEDHVSVMRGTYAPAERLGTLRVTLFRLQDLGWRRADVVIEERCHAADDVLGALRRAGFTAAVLRAEHDLGLADQAGRMFFLARRS
jgi:SAM-dependent methyltransferase